MSNKTNKMIDHLLLNKIEKIDTLPNYKDVCEYVRDTFATDISKEKILEYIEDLIKVNLELAQLELLNAKNFKENAPIMLREPSFIQKERQSGIIRMKFQLAIGSASFAVGLTRIQEWIKNNLNQSTHSRISYVT